VWIRARRSVTAGDLLSVHGRPMRAEGGVESQS
jgi:hypothetical protein